jgi:uroporphyrinogen-III synthase
MSTAEARHSLAGHHIAITRPPEQAPEFARLLEEAGARVTVLSTIAIEPVADTSHLDAALRALATYDWIVLTSVNGVRALADRLPSLGLGWEARGLARIAVIGPATARALEAEGVSADRMPHAYVAEGILDALGNVAGQHILLPRADIARKTLAEELRVRGADVDEVAAYSTVVRPAAAEELRHVLDEEQPEAITFTSSSTVRGLMAGLAELGRDPSGALQDIALACIGPITAGTLREYGLEPTLIADEYTVPGLVRALGAHFAPASAPREGV